MLADSHRATPALVQARAAGRTILCLIALVVVLRAPGLGRPLLGDFATKNVVYAMVARNWVEGRASLLTPSLDCLVDGDKQAWHLLEVPLPAYAAGICWQAFGGSLDVWGRLISVLASAVSVVLLYLLARRWHGESAGRAAAVVLALAPVSVIYGQSFMLEASVVALALGTVWAIDRWRERPRAWLLVLAASLFALLLLTKIYMLVLLLPLAWLVLATPRAGSEAAAAEGNATGMSRQLRSARLWGTVMVVGVLLLAAVPAIAWCGYAVALSEPGAATSARVYYSLRDSAASHGFPHQLLLQPGFYARVVRNLATVALTPVGLGLLLVGLWNSAWRRHIAWLISGAVLLLVLPRKFHEMNYYYLVVLPPQCLIAGLGWEALCRRFGGRRLLAAVAGLGLACSLRYGVRPAFVTPAEDTMVIAAAQRVQALTPPGTRIVTMHGWTVDLLYYANRPGVALGVDERDLDLRLAEQQQAGAQLLAVAAQQDFLQLPLGTQRALSEYQLIESGAGYWIYRMSAASLSEAEPTVTARARSSLADRR